MNEQQGLDPMFQENGSQWMEGGLASEPLNVYTAKTFGWMFLGLLVTFGTAIAFSAGGGLYYLLTMGMPAVFALAIAEIVVVMVLSARLHKLSIGGGPRPVLRLRGAQRHHVFRGLFRLRRSDPAHRVRADLAVFRRAGGLRLVHQARPFRPASYPDGRADLPFGILGSSPCSCRSPGSDRIICFVGLAVFMGLYGI